MINEYVQMSKMDQAVAYAFRPEVTQANLPMLMSNDPPLEDYRVMALVLSVKNPRDKTKTIKYSGKDTAVSYHRLCLCRDLDSGEEFYFLTTNPTQTASIFPLFRQSQLHGAFIALLEPIYKQNKILEIPLLTLKEAISPATINLAKILLNDIIPDPGSNLITTFLFATIQLSLVQCKFLSGCPAPFCDGYHGAEILCPAPQAQSSGSLQMALSCLVSVPNTPLKLVSHISASLAKYFIAHNSLTKRNLDIPLLKVSIRQTVQYYAERNVRWLIGGWYKRNVERGTTKLHISTIRPETVLPEAPLFSTEVPEPANIEAGPVERRQRARRFEDENVPGPAPPHVEPPARAPPAPRRQRAADDAPAQEQGQEAAGKRPRGE
ncbi:uncharacterized protein LOC108666115 [Hyalella azteca]|uniref:Uncharacterized protein LOC108666115 n=1 Tax=Hyalella azteca TaxID=294128 RepID=A0A8B7N3I9_HYAAZ|nr:uncharacterized protein LOC108666115 [Hyalella azteca]